MNTKKMAHGNGFGRLWAYARFVGVLVLAGWGGMAGAAEWDVTHAGDSGAGSLRDAYENAVNNDTIKFSAALDGQTITLATPLAVADGVTLTYVVPLGVNVTLAGSGTNAVLAASASSTINLPAGLTIRDGCFDTYTGPANGAGLSASTVQGDMGANFVNNQIWLMESQFYTSAMGSAFTIETLNGDLAGQISGNGISVKNSNTGAGAVTSARGNRVVTLDGNVTGSFSDNTTEAHGQNGLVQAFGGGLAIYSKVTGEISGTFTGNTVTATAMGGDVYAGGGGLHFTGRNGNGAPVVVTDATFTGNAVVASSDTGIVHAGGGAIYMNTGDVNPTLILRPTTALTIQGNTVAVNGGAARASGIHYAHIDEGELDYIEESFLKVEGAGTVNLLDPVTVDMPKHGSNVPMFTMEKNGTGTLNWGGANVLDAAQESVVKIYGGTINLVDGFSLDHGGVNNPAGQVEFTVWDDDVVVNVEGTATFTNTHFYMLDGEFRVADDALLVVGDGATWTRGTNGLLNLGAGAGIRIQGDGAFTDTDFTFQNGQRLIVDAGTTFTVGATNTLAFDGGVLSVGMADGLDAGKVASQNATVAPTFAGANTLDISAWKAGTHTVLTSAAAMDAGAAATFTAFTIGGMAVNPTAYTLSVANAADNQSLVVTAALNQDSLEKTWAGGSGAWNYSADNWRFSGFDTPFVLGDAAWFDGTGAAQQTIAIGGTSLALSGMKVSGDVDYTFTGGALNIDAANRQGSALDGNESVGFLIKEGGGTLLLDNGTGNVLAGEVAVRAGVLALGDGFALANGGAPAAPRYVSVHGDAIVEVRGGVSLENLRMQLAYDSTLRFTGENSRLTLHNENGGDPAISFLYAGTLDVDLNRNPEMPVLKTTGDDQINLSLQSGRSTSLVLRHTGLVSQTADWLLIDGVYTGAFDESITYATANLSGELRYETDRVYFDGAYVVADDRFPGFDAMAPNAQRAWAGFRDAWYNHPNAFMQDLSAAYASPAAFQADLPALLKYTAPEGAVSQGLAARGIHAAFAESALSTAFPDDAGAFASGATASRPVSEAGRAWVGSEAAYANLYEAGRGPRFWGGYFGSFGRQDDHDRYEGYRAVNNGVHLGAAFDVSCAFTAGVYGGYHGGHTDYRDLKQRIDSDAGHFGAFARYRRGGFKGTFDALYTYADNDARRDVPTLLGVQRMTGSFDQHIFGAGAELAYDWSPAADSALVFSPFVSGRFTRLVQDGFRERGTLAQDVGGTHANSFATRLGLDVARDFMAGDRFLVTPRLRIGWQHEWADTDVSATSRFLDSPVSYAARSVKQDRDALLLGAGVDLLTRQGARCDMNLSLGYEAELRRRGHNQNVFAALGIRF